MNNLLHNHFFVILLSIMLIPITGQSYNQTYDVKVGDTFTVYTTYHSNTTSILWTIPYEYIDPVGYVGPVATSVTFRAKKAIPSGVSIQATTRVNYGSIDYVDDWLVCITDGEPGPGPDPNLHDGDIFYDSWNGVQMRFKVISASEKTCMVGAGSAEESDLAVSSSLNEDAVFIHAVVKGFRVVEVASSAFCKCKNIKKIFLPESITKIGENAFQDCDGLTFLTVPDNVTYIDDGAFSKCDNLEEVTLGSSINELGFQILWDCDKLKSLICLPTTPPKVSSWGLGVESHATLYVPAECVNVYKNANYWNRFTILPIGGEPDTPDTPYVLWCEGNTTLYFLSSPSDVNVGDTHNGQTITKVWKYSPSKSEVWRGAVMDKLTKVVFESTFASVRPTNCDNWFLACSKLEQIDGLEYLNTSVVTSMYCMFQSCSSLKSLDLSSFDTKNVTNMLMMFAYCKELESLNLRNFNTSSVSGTNMDKMFYGCKKLKYLDLSSFDTRNVTDMSEMFYDCRALESIDLSSFDTGNVTDMESMFQSCTSLKELNLGNFNTSNVTNMRAMFYWCPQLTKIDVSNFDVSRMTSLQQMFVLCENLTTLDLSSFDTHNITNMDSFLSSCTNLKTVYVSNKWVNTKVEISSYMFSGCINIVGGNGTHYDSQYQDATYARIDKSNSPGYFTDINHSSIYVLEYNDDEATHATFSLSGQYLAAPKKGINIIDGKKVIVK